MKTYHISLMAVIEFVAIIFMGITLVNAFPLFANALVVLPETSHSACINTVDDDLDGQIDGADSDCYPSVLIRKEVAGSLAQPGEFTITVTHPNGSTENVPGSTAGIEVFFSSDGSFSITEIVPVGYSVSYSGACSGASNSDYYGERIGTCVVRNEFGGTGPTPESLDSLGSCTDGIDNDEDGLIDSEDSGCQSGGTDPTPENLETSGSCTDGIDNDQDGLIDEEDSGCQTGGGSTPENINTEGSCTDGIDNDEDGLIDSEDSGCNGNDEPTPENQNTEGTCTDGIDNDQDGKIDSKDNDCGDSGGGGGKRGSRHPAQTTGQVLGVATGICEPVITDYMRMGMNNDPEQVKKLQSFLTEMGYPVPVTGYFGQITDSAVRNFQLAHSDEVLKPWADLGLGSERDSTGYVYKTTLYRINKYFCGDLVMPVLP